MTLTAIHIERWVARGLVRDTDMPDPIDVARLRLLNELADDIGLDDDTVEAVVALIDQVHTLRHQLHLMSDAVAEQSPEAREAIAASLRKLASRP